MKKPTKKPTFEQIEAYLCELEAFKALCEEECYTDTAMLWHLVDVSSHFLLQFLEFEKTQGESHD